MGRNLCIFKSILLVLYAERVSNMFISQFWFRQSNFSFCCYCKSLRATHSINIEYHTCFEHSIKLNTFFQFVSICFLIALNCRQADLVSFFEHHVNFPLIWKGKKFINFIFFCLSLEKRRLKLHKVQVNGKRYRRKWRLHRERYGLQI